MNTSMEIRLLVQDVPQQTMEFWIWWVKDTNHTEWQWWHHCTSRMCSTSTTARINVVRELTHDFLKYRLQSIASAFPQQCGSEIFFQTG